MTAINFIKEWESAKEVKNVLGIRHVGCCCKGTRNTAGGFKWKYKKSINTEVT